MRTPKTNRYLKSARVRAAVPALSSTEELLAEFRAGRMVILVDDEDRENEGDLVLPAQFVTPQAINFMARYGRGLVCLALTRARADFLGLRPMAPVNEGRHQTAFTVSIEAREGVTTGISAADRALTIATAIDPGSDAGAVVSPGHVFPLVARDGGTLERAGHTEAAVDLARLSGLNPAGVICEIMNDDGTMARLPDLLRFAARHGLKVGTIADLIAYRLQAARHELDAWLYGFSGAPAEDLAAPHGAHGAAAAESAAYVPIRSTRATEAGLRPG